VTAARIPIIALYGNLIVPVQGAISDETITQLNDDVSRAIDAGAARGLIIDVSGVALMDSYITRNIRDLALTARLMGVTTIVSGLQPAVAITLIEMGLDIQGLQTTLNLERAIERLAALRAEEDETLGGADDHR
jgi:rsbT antagonist protein RsbS